MLFRGIMRDAVVGWRSRDTYTHILVHSIIVQLPFLVSVRIFDEIVVSMTVRKLKKMFL
jgi:predicted class III extradiol MEMO1 family dioxygenase